MRLHRKQKKMTIQQVADQLGKAKNTISLLELGKTGIDLETLQKYCAAIGDNWLAIIQEANHLSSREDR